MEQIILAVVLILVILYFVMPRTSRPMVMWFYGENCGHCTRMDPAWREFAKMCPAYIDIKKINIAENQQMADEYGVNGVPYIVKECDGKRQVYQGDRSAMDIYKFATATF